MPLRPATHDTLCRHASAPDVRPNEPRAPKFHDYTHVGLSRPLIPRLIALLSARTLPYIACAERRSTARGGCRDDKVPHTEAGRQAYGTREPLVRATRPLLRSAAAFMLGGVGCTQPLATRSTLQGCKPGGYPSAAHRPAKVEPT
eukprot:scaffold30405_cov52-Phaeocystis_antarctica.AAC.3